MEFEKNIWIIEDVEDLQFVYRNIFSESHIVLTFFKSFQSFANALEDKNSHPDLIIADIMLGNDHFFQLLNEADLSLNVPYLVISGRDDYETISNAYAADAIDYILKPLNHDEIKAKVERHLRNIEEKTLESSKSLEALNIDFTNFTNKEVKIIESFNQREDKTLHRNEIVQIIWKNIAIHPNTLDVHIYNLRKKLKEFNYGIKAIGGGHFTFIDNSPRQETNESSLSNQVL